MRAALAMPDTLRDPAAAHSADPLAAPFSRAWRTPLPMFAWLALPQHAARLARFGNAMAGISGLTPPDAILRGQPAPSSRAIFAPC